MALLPTVVTWQQGADLVMPFIYQEGADEESLVTIDLSSGYAVRMDIVTTAGERIYTFNSADITDVDPITAGAQADAVKEATLTSGAGGTPNINIVVPRALTLPGGVVYAELDTSGNGTFNFDVFLRNTGSDTQAKIAKGSITVEGSHTLWL